MLSSSTQRLFAPLMLLLALAIIFALYKTLGGPSSAPPLHKEPTWTWFGGSGVSGWDVVTDETGNVYTHSGDLLFAIDPHGTELWRVSAPLGYSPRIAAGGGTVYGADSGGNLHSFDGVSGKHKWWQHVAHTEPGTNYVISGWPSVAPNGNVYIASREAVAAYDNAGNRQLAITQFAVPAPGAPVQLDNNNNVYFDGPKQSILAFDTAGQQLYPAIERTGGAFKVCPVDSQVYNFGEDRLRVFSSRGKPSWTKEHKVAVISFDDKGNVYCGCGDGVVRAFSAQGRQLWKTELWVSELNAAGSGPLYAVAGQRSVIALDKQTGRKLWSYESPPQAKQYGGQDIGHITVSPSGTAYFAGLDGRVYAIGP